MNYSLLSRLYPTSLYIIYLSFYTCKVYIEYVTLTSWNTIHVRYMYRYLVFKILCLLAYYVSWLDFSINNTVSNCPSPSVKWIGTDVISWFNLLTEFAKGSYCKCFIFLLKSKSHITLIENVSYIIIIFKKSLDIYFEEILNEISYSSNYTVFTGYCYPTKISVVNHSTAPTIQLILNAGTRYSIRACHPNLYISLLGESLVIDIQHWWHACNLPSRVNMHLTFHI